MERSYGFPKTFFLLTQSFLLSPISEKIFALEQILKEIHTLDSGINIGVRLLIFGLFSRGYVLIREGNAYFFSKFPLFDGIGDAYFKSYA